MVAAGDKVTSADTTTIEDYTIRMPLVRLVQAVAQSIPDNVPTFLTFTTEDIDTHNFHDNTTNNDRITPTIAGYYRVRGAFCPAARSDFNTLLIQTAKNGTLQAPSERRPFGGTSVGSSYTIETDALLSANGSTDYFSINVTQDNVANVAVNTVVGGTSTSVFEVEFLRPL